MTNLHAAGSGHRALMDCHQKKKRVSVHSGFSANLLSVASHGQLAIGALQRASLAVCRAFRRGAHRAAPKTARDSKGNC
jgi:hypothetical protein